MAHEVAVCDDATGNSDAPNVRFADGSADGPDFTRLDRTRSCSPGMPPLPNTTSKRRPRSIRLDTIAGRAISNPEYSSRPRSEVAEINQRAP